MPEKPKKIQLFNINISNDVAEDFKLMVAGKLASAKEKLQEAKFETDKWQAVWNEIVEKTTEYSNPNKDFVFYEPNKSDYDPTFTWVRKIRFFLKKFGPMTTAQLVDRLIEYEPDTPRSTALSSLSATLSLRHSADGSNNSKPFTRTETNSGDFIYDINPNYIAKFSIKLLGKKDNTKQ